MSTTKKELGVCLPQIEIPISGLLVQILTVVTEKIAVALDKEVFSCYAGLPPEKIVKT